MLGFILALGAGFLTPHVEDQVARPVAKAIKGLVDIPQGEMRALSFILMMTAAAALAWLLGAQVSARWFMIGGALGFVAVRLVAGLSKKAGRSDD
jgi:hypothetical protein